jgi:Ca-activated chloride channel family protein
MQRSLCILVATAVWAQQPSWAAQAPESNPLFRSRVDLVALTVTVQDRDGSFVRTLGRHDFHVLEGGVEQTISVFGAGEVPVDLVLMVDTSGSMAGQLAAAQHAATILINSLSNKDRAAVFSFGGRITQSVGLTNDRAALTEGIRKMGAGGMTPLYDALYIALKEFGVPHGEIELRRRALVLLSDGDDNSSHVTFDSVLKLARQLGVGIYTVLLRSTPPPLADERSEVTAYEMKTLARETGAQAFAPLSSQNLDSVYASIAKELASQYSVGYIPQTRAAPTFVRVTVLVDRSNSVVRTRTGYVSAVDLR